MYNVLLNFLSSPPVLISIISKDNVFLCDELLKLLSKLLPKTDNLIHNIQSPKGEISYPNSFIMVRLTE